MSSRIELGEVIGRGGFGTVHRARIHGEGLVREVAVKLLRPEHAGREAIVRRLRDEARMLACVRHRAVVRVEDLIDLGGSWAVVMELVPGASLAEILAEHGPLPEGPAVELAREVAGALAAGWEARGPDGAPLRLQHRDVKPGNILLTSRGEVKLLDFGIARAALAGREALTTTMGFGTPEYMAPERFDARDLPAGDVYSLGCTLLEALTATPPVRTSARADRHDEVWAEALERASASGASPELVALLCELLAYEPEDRPTAGEVEERCAALLFRSGASSLSAWSGRALQKQQLAPPTPTSLVAPPVLVARSRGRWALVAGGLLAIGTVGWVVQGSRQVQAVPEVESALPAAEAPTTDREPTATVPAAAARNPVAPSSEEPAAVAESAASPPSEAPVLVGPTGSGAASGASGPPTSGPLSSPPAPPTAAVAVTGDAAEVSLVGEAGTFTAPGEVPEGSYSVRARFGEAGEMACGSVRVLAGRSLTVHTDAAFTSCEER